MAKKTGLNLFFTLTVFLIQTGLSFWLVPFYVKNIGAVGYGFVPLIQQMIGYMTVITLSITALSGRFFTIAKEQGDVLSKQEYFSSSFTATLIGSGILLLPILVFAAFVHKILHVPFELLLDVRISVLISGAIFLTGFLTSTFNNGAFSSNKLYLTSGIEMINTGLRAIITILLLLCFVPRIWFVSLGIWSAGFICSAITVAVFRKLEPDVKILRLSFVKVKEILSSGIWISIGQIGVILFLQIDLLIANLNLGSQIAGIYAVVLYLPMTIRGISGSVNSIFGPTIISLYALQKTKEMVDYVNRAVKYVGMALSLPIGVICGFGSVFLALWLGEEYRVYGVLLTVMTFHLSVNLSVQTVMGVQTAVNKLKVPAFVTLLMGALNFLLAFGLSKRYGMIGIAVAACIVLTLKNLIFTPLYVAHITGQAPLTYFHGVIKPIFSTIFVAAISFFVGRVYPIKSFFEFVIAGMVISIIYFIFAYVFLLKGEERIKIKRFLCRRSV